MNTIFNHYASSILSALPKERLLALDIFRGITIAAMILVNNPGSWSYVYAPLRHAQWHGYTPTDLIFPFFVFIVGISISIVMQREIAKGTDKKLLLKNAGTRATKLFVLGLFLALFYYDFSLPDYSWLLYELYQVRVLGVLQRLGLVFFITVAIVLWFGNYGRLLWFIGLLIGYWLALLLIPYTLPDGTIEQGGLAYGNSLAAWFDHVLIGAQHLYYSTAEPLAFDPEGLLSTLPAVSSCLAGVFTGQIITNPDKPLHRKVKLFLSTGLVMLVVGHLWHLGLPINKALWTPSYVFISTGWALLSLALLIWLVDMKGYKAWSAPFVVFGANAIFFYVFSAILARMMIMIPVENTSLQGAIYYRILQPAFGYYNGSLMFAIMFLLVSYLIMHWLYKKQIFFKV